MDNGLTQNDLRLLARLSNGETVKELADKGFSYDSAKVALYNIRKRLGASTNAQAVAQALRRGMME